MMADYIFFGALISMWINLICFFLFLNDANQVPPKETVIYTQILNNAYRHMYFALFSIVLMFWSVFYV